MSKAVKVQKKFGMAEVALIFSIAILVAVVAVPVIMIFLTAFFKDGHFNLAGVVEVLKQKDTYLALKNSLIIAFGVTLFSTIIGVFFAWLLARTDIPCKKALNAMFMVPFMLPSFICAMAWKVLLSPRSGYINKMLISQLKKLMKLETKHLLSFLQVVVSHL